MAGLLTSEKKKVGLLTRDDPYKGTLGDFAQLPSMSFATKTSTQAIPDATTPDTVDFLKKTGQSIARGYGAVGQGIVSAATGGKAPVAFTPQGKVQQAIFGTDKSFSLQDVGEEYPGVPKGAGFAPFIGGLGVALDLVGGGGLKGLKGLTTALKDANAVADAARLMKGAGFTDDIIKDYSPLFAKSKDVAEIEKGLLVAENLQNTTRGTSAGSRIESKTPSPLADGGKIETNTVERGFITSVKEVIPEAEKVAGQYIPRSTDALSIKAANFVKDDITAATRFALEGTNDAAVATASELLKHYAKLARETVDVAVKNSLYDQAAEIANTLAPKLTEQGRAIQAASILGRLTPEGQVRFAAKEIQKWNSANPTKKVPELTGEQAGKILDEMEEIRKMSEGDGKAIRFQKLQETTRALIPSRWWDKLTNIWKAGLLTGIKTSGLNILANVSHTGLEILKDIPAAGIDMIASALLGTKRTTTFGVKGTAAGMKEGFQKGWQYLKTGYDSRNVAKKLDYTRVKFKSKAFQTYVEGVFRVLGAEDQPFYYGALKRSLYNQARVAAKNRGLKGAEADTFIKELVESPNNDMAAYALADAETAVFQNKTALGTAASSVVRAAPGAGFVIPFARTPSSVAMQVINYTPVGNIVEIVRQIVRGKFDQRSLAQTFGRSVVGSIPIFIGTQLYDNDLISLDYPDTGKERESWKAEGKTANSINVNGQWRTVQVFGPAGPLILMGGHFQRALKNSGTPTGAITEAVFGTLKSFTEQTFLKGVNDIMGAITDPERNAEYVASSFISSWIPTIINDVARSTDPKERRAETVLQRVRSRIPGLRQGLEPQVNILGQERDRAGSSLETMFDPTRPSTDTATPVTQEMKRLDVSPTMLGDKKGYRALSQEENTKLWKLTGSIINDKVTTLLTRETYQKLSDEDKGKVITKIVDMAKTNARVAVVMKQTQGLSGDELKAMLRKLKETGLLTTEIFKKWSELR